MKKFLWLLVCISTLSKASPQEIFSRSFMFTRPASFNIAMDMQLWHNFVYTKKGPLYGAFQAIGLYQQSIKQNKTARYFLINDKNSLVVAGDLQTDVFFTRDIRAEWLDLPADFQASLSLCPEQRQAGGKIFYNQDLKNFFSSELFANWSVGIEMPILWVENNINFTQCLVSSGTVSATYSNLFEAFNATDWCYAKIPACKQSRVRPANIKLTLGRDFPLEGYSQCASFMSLEIPIGHHQNPEYMFDPVVGNDQHFGLGGALVMQVQLNRHAEDYGFSFFINLEGMFLIRNHQYRTYDLQGKPWSRYMKFVRKDADPGDTIPGVNVLTLSSIVRPFGIADFSLGWRLDYGMVELEIGYDLWGHGGEKVELRDPPIISPFNKRCGGLNEFGIAGAGTITVKGRQVAATASKSTISCLADDDDHFIGIDQNDLNVCTPATGSAVNQKVHVAAGVQHIGDVYGGFMGIGAFREWAQKNSPLSTWGVWLKFGASF